MTVKIVRGEVTVRVTSSVTVADSARRNRTIALSRTPSPLGVTVVSIGESPANGWLPFPTRRYSSRGAWRSIVSGLDAIVRSPIRRRTR